MRRLVYLFGVWIFIAGLSSCGSGFKEVRPETDREFEMVADHKLDSFFTALQSGGMFNGAVAVKKNGELLLKKGYGTANVREETPFLPSTKMEVASVSKQFTAAAILILQQEGKLDVRDPAAAHLREDFPYPGITIRHLLTHTSGLPDYEKYFRETWDTTRIVSNDDILDFFKKEKPELISVPGERYHYSNSGYVMLAAIVNEVSGKSLDRFLEEEIFRPAGMGDSGFYDREQIWTTDNYAPGYMRDPVTCSYVRPEALPGRYYYHFLSGRLGPGRLTSSVNDLLKWDRVLYSDEILNDRSRTEAFTPHPPSVDSSDYGYGWHIYDDRKWGKVAYHTGSWAGNLAYIKRFVDTRSLIITLNNTYDNQYSKEIRRSVEDYLKGKPLMLPDEKGDVVLERVICDLNEDDIDAFLDANPAVVWDMQRLRKLEEKYQNIGEKEKAHIVRLVADRVK